MSSRIPRKSIAVTIYSRDDKLTFINNFRQEFEFEVSVACRMSTTPSRNGGQVVIVNLGEAERNQIAGVISRRVDYTNASLGPGSDGFIPLVGGKIITGTDVVPGGFAREETINNGDGYVEIDAGEGSDVGRIFEGSCKHADHEHAGTDWLTTLDVKDGLSTMIGGHVNDRFGPGTEFYPVVRHLVKAMGLDKGNLTQATLQEAMGAEQSSFPNGYVTAGNPQQMLTAILRTTKAEWFVDRGTFYVVAKGESLPGRPACVDIQSGLIGKPKPLEDGGVGINMVMRKDVRVGRDVELSSTQLSGLYRCEVVDHRINNYVDSWRSTAILRQGGAIQGILQ